MEGAPLTSSAAVRSDPPAEASAATPTEIISRLQAQIARLEEALLAADRLALLGTLTTLVSHEVNNLMTPLLARAEFALSSGKPADLRRALERSLKQVQQAAAVAQRLLAFAQPGPPGVARCAVADAVREALETATRPLKNDGIREVLDVPPALHVRAEPTLFQQVLLNLILNAREAMRDMRGELTIIARRDGDLAVIEVRDTGRGIPPDLLENAIRPILSGRDDARSPNWPAVGCGLYVCSLIARRHGATIEAEPNADRGCTFRLRWPAEP